MSAIARRSGFPLSPRKIFRYLKSSDVPKAPKLLMLLAIIYLIMPVDLIPDIAPIIGWIDDAGIMSLTLAWLGRSIHQYELGQPSISMKSPDKKMGLARDPKR